jgi:hypothetical protein
MNPSFLRLRGPMREAMSRYDAWLGTPELSPPREVADRDAIDLSLDGERWKGLAVFIYEAGPWIVFEEVSGGLAGRSAENWVRLANGGDLLYAGYNDAIGYGEFVEVDGGRLVRHFLQDEQDPGANVNVGRLPEEAAAPWGHWADVAGWMDEEDRSLTARERGWLWIHRAE